MKLKRLLQEFESLPHAARVRRMIELGHFAKSDADVAATITLFERGSFYERGLALNSCYSSRDGAQVLRALADPSQAIRGAALRLAALVCDDTQVSAALAALAPNQQRRLLKLLAARRRYTPIDAFLAELDEQHLPQLVSYGSDALVAQLAERALAGAGMSDWRRLAAHHPSVAADMLQRQAQAVGAFDQRLLQQANAVLPHLAEHVPDQALALVRALLSHISLYQLDLDKLMRRRPDAIADLALQSGDQMRFDFAHVARALAPDRLRALAERGLLGHPGAWLKHLAPILRRELYATLGLGWRDAEGVIEQDVVAALPGELRADEARRHLTLPALATRPSQRLPYAALLPWDEARAALDPFMRNPDPELRRAALAALIGAARYQATRLPDTLRIILDRRNEQDPVRQTMLYTLADLPPSRWQANHLPELGKAIRAALDAADCSPATAAAAERLVIALLPFQPDWSAQWLATLGRERGVISSYHLAQKLSEADVRRIAPALLPVLQAWQPREREQAIFSAAAMFGRRLVAFPELTAILEQLTRDARAWVASRALALIARHRRERLPELIPALLKKDPSWVTQPVVYTFLHRHRQDLLTPLLGQTAYKGRFSTGKTRFVLPLLSGFQRWTPAQQQIFAKVLDQVTRDEQRDSPALFMTINQLAALPAIAPARIIELADLQNTRLAARDVALRALGRLDAGHGIATLLTALDDDRARIAIYALRRSLLQMPTEQALDLLRGVSLRKVTVAKETVRLLGELPGSAAYADLLAIAGQELHRDVRVALLRALWDHLEQPETWPLLEQAAESDDPALASGVIRISADRRPPATLRRIVRLLALLLANPSAQVRLDTLQRCATLPIVDPERALQEPLFAALGSPIPDERAAAARAVFATYAGRDADLVGGVVRRILPNRRALVTLLEQFNRMLPWNRSRMLPAVRATLDALANDPLTAALQVTLAATALLLDDLAALLRQLATADLLHAEVVTAAVAAILASARRTDADVLAAFEQALAGEADARLRRIALAALVALAQSPRGWNAELLARLEIYRADPAALVAAAAQFTFPIDDPSPLPAQGLGVGR
jgi:hypothetical protein